MSSNQYTPNGGKTTSGQGWRYESGNQNPGGRSGGQPPKKPEFNIGEWIPIIILFCIPSGVTQCIAFFWALSKVIRIVKANKQYQEQLRQFGRTAASVTRDVTDAVRKEVLNAHTTHAAPQSRVAHSTPGAASAKHGDKKSHGGTGLIVFGAIVAAIFAISTLAAGFEFLGSLLNGYFFSDELLAASLCALFTGGGLAMLFTGIGKNHRRERALNYLAYIGTNREVDLAQMAASFDVPIKKLCKDLRWMLSKGILPTGYLDLAAGRLFLTEAGYRAPEPAEEKTAEELKQEEDDILREIRQVNDDIPDEVMSAKIDRIEEITGKILAYQKTHPDRSGQLRSFLNYYLPTTLKILRAYVQLDAQGIEGENISAAKARIEGMMDQVVAGFEKQLDKLFQDDAMDISSDVQVLENMLKKDGLSDDPQNMTMTL